MNSRRAGFTLVELTIVMVILGIMATLTVLSVRGHIDRARQMRSFEQIEQLDRMARIAARRDASPYQITFSRSKRKAVLRAIGYNAPKKSLREYKLPSSLQFAAFQHRSVSSRADELAIEITSSGQSPSYAISLQASSGPPQWLVTLGFSGQQIRMETAKDVAAMFP